MSLDNIFGSHSAFYYYSKEHLFVNLLKYIKEGLDNNELIYILIDKADFEDLTGFLKKFNIPINNIYILDTEKFDFFQTTLITNLLHEQIHKKLQTAVDNGFSGIRFIEDCSYIINLTSKDFFINLEKNLSAIIQCNNISVLCTYDVYDYIQNSSNQHIITRDVIDNSFCSHSHLLKKFNLCKINNDEKAI